MTDQDSDVAKVLAALTDPPIEHFLGEMATAFDPPVVAIAACLMRYDEAGPALLAALEKAASGEALTPGENRLCFRGLYILAGHREPKAFEPLLRLLRRPAEEIDLLSDDEITESLPRIAIGVFDDNTDALLEAIIDTKLDQNTRGALLRAGAFLTFDGRIERERMETFLRSFREEQRAENGGMVWGGWAEAVALLGLRSLLPMVKELFRADGMVGSYVTLKGFTDDLTAAESSPQDPERFEDTELGYIEDAYDAISQAEASRIVKAEYESARVVSSSWRWPATPVINPLRHVGRNDSCPCGSGKKAKRCCLAS